MEQNRKVGNMNAYDTYTVREMIDMMGIDTYSAKVVRIGSRPRDMLSGWISILNVRTGRPARAIQLNILWYPL